MKEGAIYDQLRANPDLPLDSKLILEIPQSNLQYSKIDDFIQAANLKGVELRFKPE